MPDPSPLTRAVHDQLLRLLDGPPHPDRLNAALRHLAKWRSALVANSLAQLTAGVIRNGPFEGMIYRVPASEGSYPARLLGAYEASLAPVIEGIIAQPPGLIVDVGCAEGYYAVGLARRLPQVPVWARDASDTAQSLCRNLCAQNGVTNVTVGGLLTHADLAVCAAQPTVLICDIEGAEAELLDPAAAPALARADILVEVHEGMRPGLLSLLEARFAATHRITRLGRHLVSDALPPQAEGWSDMDRLIALWEWRASPTPWLWMQAGG
jgi:hypothetical protein